MITIIDYGLGNLANVKNAFDKISAVTVVSSDASVIEKSEGIVIPGVGSAFTGMANLRASGLDKVVINAARNGKPMLGICLGMQLLFTSSEEGNVDCLGLVKGQVKQFTCVEKVPQIGWNQVSTSTNCIFTGIENVSNFYFVHSFFCDPTDKEIVCGTTVYGQKYCSAIACDNIYGVQFHPEKSGGVGLGLLRNFVNIVYENNPSN